VNGRAQAAGAVSHAPTIALLDRAPKDGAA